MMRRGSRSSSIQDEENEAKFHYDLRMEVSGCTEKENILSKRYVNDFFYVENRNSK